MIREVPQYLAREVSNAPSVVIEDTPRRTAAGFWNLMAKNFATAEATIANQAERKYALSLDAVRKQEINRIESEYQGEPEAMQKAFIANKEGMIGAIESAEMKEKFAIAYDLEILPSLNRAVAAKTKRLDEGEQSRVSVCRRNFRKAWKYSAYAQKYFNVSFGGS